MIFWVKARWTTLLLSALLASSVQATPQQVNQLQFASFAIRDIPATVEESRLFQSGGYSLDQYINDWLESAEHTAKVRRFFFDIFGTRDFSFDEDPGFTLKTGASGALSLDGKGECSAADAVQVGAWWLEPGETVSMCASNVDDGLEYGSGDNLINCTWVSAPNDSRCGCGPNQILCFPDTHSFRLYEDLLEQFVNRGQYAYENDQTWLELFSAEQFYGSRLLYHFYLFGGIMRPLYKFPSQAELNQLAALPVEGNAWAPMPSGPDRAPWVTSANFLGQYNNARTRIRAITQRLLCQDVSPILNISGIQSFVNPDLSEADRAHGTKESCAGCHWVLDNMAPIMANWTDQGKYHSNPTSEVGHVFGEEGTGPIFLLQSFVENGPGFDQCMAKQVWEGFTGNPWTGLPADSQSKFAQSSTQGVRRLIRDILTSTEFKGLR